MTYNYAAKFEEATLCLYPKGTLKPNLSWVRQPNLFKKKHQNQIILTVQPVANPTKLSAQTLK
jgi:hypothetical protein